MNPDTNGAHRNILMKSILAVATRSGEESEEWFQYDIDDDGLFTAIKTKLSEDGILLTYKNTGEPLDDEYARDKDKKYVSDNPIEAVKFTFGDAFLPEDVDTFEKVYDIIENNPSFKWKKFREEIKAVAKKRYEQAVKRLVIPEEFL